MTPRWMEKRYVKDGLSLRDIAREIGRSTNFVRDRLIKRGVVFSKGVRISKKMVGKPSSRRGATLSRKHREVLRKIAMGNTYCVGRTYTEKTLHKMRESQRRRHSTPDAMKKRAVSAITRIKRQKFKNLLKSLLRKSGNKKSGRTSDVMGYTREELVRHISFLFLPGMSWEDRTSFSIDHIVPVAEFIKRGIVEPKIVCSLVNLQPLKPKTNRSKSAKYTGPFKYDLERINEFNQKKVPAYRRQILTKKSVSSPYEEGIV